MEVSASVPSMLELRQGADIVLDGRGVKVPGYERGNFVGPTIIAGVKPHMQVYLQEVFGPVLVCLEVRCLQSSVRPCLSLLTCGQMCATLCSNFHTVSKPRSLKRRSCWPMSCGALHLRRQLLSRHQICALV